MVFLLISLTAEPKFIPFNVPQSQMALIAWQSTELFLLSGTITSMAQPFRQLKLNLHISVERMDATVQREKYKYIHRNNFGLMKKTAETTAIGDSDELKFILFFTQVQQLRWMEIYQINVAFVVA